MTLMPCETPNFVKSKKLAWQHPSERVPIPCGYCATCKKNRINGWVHRLLEEEKVSSSAHFVTFTYSSERLPFSPCKRPTLKPKHMQLFFKKLRRRQERKYPNAKKIRYYYVGEYGEKRKRPHYHAIIFNVVDQKFFGDCWTEYDKVTETFVSLGAVDIGNVSGDSIAYTAKYIDKAGKVGLHPNDHRIKKFSRMSKGLGSTYINNPEIIKYHRSDYSKNYVTLLGGVKVAMPKYYRDKLFSDSEKALQRAIITRNVERKKAKDKLKFVANYPEQDYDEYMHSRTIAKSYNYHKRSDDNRKKL